MLEMIQLKLNRLVLSNNLFLLDSYYCCMDILCEYNFLRNYYNITCKRFYVYAQLKALKQNLLVKQLLQRRQKPSIISESHHELGQLLRHQNNDNVIDFVVTNTDRLEHKVYNGSIGQEDEDHNSQKQQLKQKRKQEMLERNRYL